MSARKKMAAMLLALLAAVTCIAPAMADVIDNVTARVQSNGDIVLRWEDSAHAAPYEVSYQHDDSPYMWVEADSYPSTIAQLKKMVPGQHHEIRIENADGDSATVEYDVPMYYYSEFDSVGRFVELSKTKCSISEAMRKPSDSFQVRISWPQLKYAREYTCKIVVRTPFGYSSYMGYYEDFVMHNRYQYNYVTYSFYDELKRVEDEYGSIPTGDYVYEVYFDGEFYDSATLRVTD